MLRAELILLLLLPSLANAVTLTWDAPTQNTDGTPITQPITYRIYCGDGTFERYASTVETSIDLAPCVPNAQFRVTADTGRESAPSNIVFVQSGNDSNGTPLPPVIVTQPCTPCAACPVCPTCADPVITWRVQPWRDAATRPVYSAQRLTAGERVEIGRVNVGTECGDFVMQYSATVTALEWRRVTATNMEDGAAVCEQAR